MSNLRFFNTLSGAKEKFVPLEGQKVSMYACGPTVYDLAHIGHARSAIVSDFVVRYLKYVGYEVTFARNITDVDDKIINRSSESGITPEQLTRENIFQFWKDMRALNTLTPDFEPKATEYLERMMDFIEKLIDKGHAYVSEGDVYFDVSSYEPAGKLRKQSPEEQIVGARMQVRSQDELKDRKRNQIDFALWKGVKPDETGWQSPWGKGRPGWHIECSTMIKHVLGETIDIHAGGQDLIFPHHENEITQSEALHEHDLAKYWLHNGLVTVGGKKMGKSEGNFTTIQSLLNRYTPDTIRLFLLQTHYRGSVDFTDTALDAARSSLKKLVKARVSGGTPDATGSTELDAKLIADVRARFVEAMDDDFNTPEALTVLRGVADQILADTTNAQTKASLTAALEELAAVLGLTLRDTSHVVSSAQAVSVVELLLELRKSAREKKDWATSDLVRKRLLELGINVMDPKVGSATWETM